MARLNCFIRFISFQCVLFLMLFFLNVIVDAEDARICVRNPTKPDIPTANFTSFKDFLCGTKLYVDKTEFLLKFIHDTIVRRDVYVITHARRFGKSHNLQMIRFFLQVQLYPNNTIVPRNLTDSYQFFSAGDLTCDDDKVEFKPPPFISNRNEIVQHHAAQYPVIYVSFKGIQVHSSQTFEEFLTSFYTCIHGVFRDHEYLLVYLLERQQTCHERNDCEEVTFRREFFENMLANKFRSDGLKQSIRMLSEILVKKFSTKVVILIDEYDSIFTQLYLYGRDFSKDLKDKIEYFCLSFYSKSITGNINNYHMAILTGILRINLAVGSTLNFLTYYDMFSPRITAYYGISRAEASLLFDLYNLTEDKRHVIEKYYDGYSVPASKSKNGFHHFYNTFSIINHLNHLKEDLSPVAYWTGTEMMIETLKRFIAVPSIFNKLQSLLISESVKYVEIPNYKLVFSLQELQRLEIITLSNDTSMNVYSSLANEILSLFISTGYLSRYESEKSQNYFRFPNQEISDYFSELLYRHYNDHFGHSYNDLAIAFDEFLFNEELRSEKLEKAFSNFYVLHKYKIVPQVPNRKKTDIAAINYNASEAYFAIVLRAAALYIKYKQRYITVEKPLFPISGEAHEMTGCADIFAHDYKNQQAIFKLQHEGSGQSLNTTFGQLEKNKCKTELPYRCKYIAILGKIDGCIEVEAKFE